MKTFKYRIENICFPEEYEKDINADDVLYIDIETTGLSRDRNAIYIIGCGYYDENALNIIQWFAEDCYDESAVINAFNDFKHSFSILINFNGQSFDIPFIEARANKYGIKLGLNGFENIDLYTYVKPYKKLLGLNDLRQKTLEQFLKIKRDDMYSGGELIDVYKKYVSGLKHGFDDINARDILLLHNMEDVKYMHYLLPLMDFRELDALELYYVNHSLSEYAGYDKTAYEIIISCSHELSLNVKFTSILNIDDGTYASSCSNRKINLRIPVKYGTLNYFFENYKDYYYLPNEDMCVLKSVAEGVSKENRENATKENCKVSLDSKFIYAFHNSCNDSSCGIKKFKKSYNSGDEYIRLDDFEAMDKSQKDEYVNSMLKCFI